MERKREEKMEGKSVFSGEYILTSPPPAPKLLSLRGMRYLVKKNLMFFFGEEI